MARKLPWPEIVVTALVIAAGAGVYLYAHKDEGALEESKRRGEVLVDALVDYDRTHGTFPQLLADLVPEYVAAVPEPTWGLQRWHYRTYTADEARPPADSMGGSVFFQLSVAADESGYPVLYYDPVARRWVLNN